MPGRLVAGYYGYYELFYVTAYITLHYIRHPARSDQCMRK